MSSVGQLAHTTYRMARRIVVAVVGGTLVLVGVVMIVAPGPAFVVIPLGLGVLAIEFSWAKRWLERVKSMIPASARPRNGSDQPAAREDLPVG
jgi:uncharacterized protein (TIGR02611 family)